MQEKKMPVPGFGTGRMGSVFGVQTVQQGVQLV